MTSNSKSTDVENQKIWINSVKKTLSAEQKTKLDAWLDKRKTFLRTSAVAAFVARVDLKLLLSPDQREKLTVWVDKNHGQQLVEKLESPEVQNQGVIFLGQGQFKVQQDSSIHAEVAAILSDSQRDQWIRSFRPELQKLGGL